MESSIPIIFAQEGSQIGAFFTFITTHWQFCLLHFLEFAIWGSWIVVLANMLNARGFSRQEIGRIYGTMPIGTMITILFVGAIADKYVNTEVLIGVSHLVGAVLLLMMAKTQHARPFYWLALLYALAFAPTLGLVNSIVFAHDEDIFGGGEEAGGEEPAEGGEEAEPETAGYEIDDLPLLVSTDDIGYFTNESDEEEDDEEKDYVNHRSKVRSIVTFRWLETFHYPISLILPRHPR